MVYLVFLKFLLKSYFKSSSKWAEQNNYFKTYCALPVKVCFPELLLLTLRREGIRINRKNNANRTSYSLAITCSVILNLLRVDLSGYGTMPVRFCNSEEIRWPAQAMAWRGNRVNGFIEKIQDKFLRTFIGLPALVMIFLPWWGNLMIAKVF